MNVITYARVSTDDQALGLDTQAAQLAEACAAKSWTVVEHCADEGVSGAAEPDKRPELARAMARLHAGEAEALVVTKLDRLSRSVMHFSMLAERAGKGRRPWRIVVLDLGMDLGTPTGEMVANMLAVVAQMERKLIGQRTREALAELKRSGVRLGRPRMLADELRARICAERAAGATPYAIAKRLNAEDIPTANGGRAWYPATVERIAA